METNSEKLITIELLNEIGDAFNKNDADLVMTFFSDDCIVDHGSGPDVFGKRFTFNSKVFSCIIGYN